LTYESVWSNDELDRFEEAREQFGDDAEKVQAHVKTRKLYVASPGICTL
jgi:cytochrome c556